MRSRWIGWLLAGALVASTGPLTAQNPTGTLSGNVTSAGVPVVGATVTVTSERLQGARTATTGAGGDYLLPFLPAGEYSVTIELSPLAPATGLVKVSATQDVRFDAELVETSVSEEVVVSASLETISTGSQSTTTREYELVEKLPINRTIAGAALTTPGVVANGPNGNLMISGAPSYESLYLVNGVVVNENLRGQPHNLFIEDAVEEFSVSTSGISAEYGRFTGGVVSVVTKSGGNDFSASLRNTFTNEDWVARTPVTVERADDLNQRLEATLGGRILRDHLWFFLSGRDEKTEGFEQTSRTLQSYATANEEVRFEGKLTASLAGRHQLTASRIEVDEEEFGNAFTTVGDLESLENRQLPNDLWTAHYAGVFGSRVFGEVQYSEKGFAFENSGARTRDLLAGTWIQDQVTDVRFNSPTFCGICTPELRNNENWLGKLSLFFDSERGGAHDLVFGYDTFTDIRRSNNHQSGSDYSVFSTSAIFRPGEDPIPVFVPDTDALVVYWPILASSLGTDFKTNSAYVNDLWRLNDRLSFNLGLRYDENDGVDSAGNLVAKDSKISPRLGLTWDLGGDGNWMINASAGEYVASLANNITDSQSSNGVPAILVWYYTGPEINTDPNGPLLDSHQALRRVFDWFESIGGLANRDLLIQATIPGGTTRITEDGLKSPSTRELNLGLTKRLGSNGLIRSQLLQREWRDFYLQRIDTTTGLVDTPNGRSDLAIIENDNDLLERSYDAWQTEISWRSGSWSLGGFYTLSRLQGNVTSETAGSGPVTSALGAYPEYKDPRWNSPTGDLAADQRHRARLWAIFQAFATDRQSLSVSLYQAFDSGTPYGAVGAVRVNDLVTDPGYIREPAGTGVTYYFTDRDAFRTDDITSTSLSLNYSFKLPAFGRDLELFVQPQVLNIFNEQGVIDVDLGVQHAINTAGLARFNPFTQTPVEGVHWRRGPNFGQPINENDYQAPRTFRLSVGVRF